MDNSSTPSSFRSEPLDLVSPTVSLAQPPEMGVVLQLADGRIQACNPQAQELLGITTEQMQDDTATNFFRQALQADGSPLPAQMHPVRVALQTMQPCSNFVMGICQPSGNLMWLNVSANPLFQVNELTPYAVVTTFTQIALPPSPTRPVICESPSQQLLETLESISDAFLSLDQDWRFTYLNSQALQLINRQLPEIISKNIWEEFPETVGSLFEQEYRRAVAEKVTVSFESFFEPHNRWYGVRAYPMASGLAVYFQNITEQKAAHAAFLQQEQTAQQRLAEIEAIYTSAPIGLCVIDTELRFVRINECLAEMNGLPAAAHIGRTLRDILPEQADDLEPLYHQVIQTGVPLEHLEIHGTNSAQPGVERDWLLSLYPLKADDQQVLGVNVTVNEITELKQTEAALLQANGILRAVIDGTLDIIFIKDLQGRYVVANSTVADWLGTTVEAILDQDDTVFFPKEIAQQIQQIDHQVIQTGKAIVYEEEIPNQGIRRSLSTAKYPWFDAQGNIIGVIGISRDISDSKRAEEALRQSDERYRTLFESIDEGFCVIQILFDQNNNAFDYRFLEINPAFEQQTGLQQAEGKTARQLVPDLEEHWFEIYGQVALTGEPLRFENGSAAMNRWFDVYAFRIGQPESRKVAVLFKDVSERQQAAEKLQQSEARYRYLAESIPQLVWTANPQGALLDVNQRWLDFTGLTLAQAQIEGWELVIHPDDVPILTQHWLAAQTSGSYYQAEGRMLRADGVYRWHLHQAVCLKNPSGEVVKWFGTATDIEDQKQLASERERLLQQEQTAREAAEKANQMKDEFLAVLSHELRSPLNPIMGWSKLLLTGKLTPTKTVEALTTIERNAKLQSQLIEDLLDVSRILRGKLVLNIAQVNLATTIYAALETVQLAAQAKGIKIQTILEPNIGAVSGDAGRLQQILWNLLSNAVKFTPENGQVTVRLTRINHHAQIQVSDTGKGINREFLPYIFDHFRQEDAATTRKFGGLGLGLAIVRQLVELHGGTVFAESAGEGKGATFTVRLPLLNNEDLGISEQLNFDSSSLPNSASLPLAGYKILVVDDEPDSRDFIAFILEQEGAEVIALPTAIKALQVIEQIQPDLLISDIGMPEMDGYMLLRQVRTQPQEQGGQIPAIALTAYAGEVNQQQAIAAGFQQHLCKPVDPEKLLKAIAQALS